MRSSPGNGPASIKFFGVSPQIPDHLRTTFIAVSRGEEPVSMGRPKIRFSRPSGAFQVPTPGNSVCSRCSSKESTIGPVF